MVGKRHALAGLFLLVLGALVGMALIAPSTSQAVTTYTRSASCAGLDFYPTDSRTEYDNSGTMRVWRSGDTANAGSGVFRCDPGLPTGAVVKKVQFTAELDSGGIGMGDCALRRSGLSTATATTAQDLGRVAFAGTTTGVVRLTASSISNATIDNANWGYWLECQFTGEYSWNFATPYSGLFGADVIYTISSTKG